MSIVFPLEFGTVAARSARGSQGTRERDSSQEQQQEMLRRLAAYHARERAGRNPGQLAHRHPPASPKSVAALPGRLYADSATFDLWISASCGQLSVQRRGY
jgi:hypothetical protein